MTKKVEKDKTKNSSSRRSFALTADARSIFETLKASEEENRRLCGKGYFESDYIFKWPDGRPFDPDYVTKHFARLLKKTAYPTSVSTSSGTVAPASS